MNIVENPMLETQHFDYSGTRSPSRARRRYLQRGIVGRIKITQKPTALVIGDTIHCHPKIAAELRATIDKAVAGIADDMMNQLLPSLGQVFGGGTLKAEELRYAMGGPVKPKEPVRVGERSLERYMIYPTNRPGMMFRDGA